MRVVFLGNHTVGVTALRALSEEVEITGVVAHPPDPEDGTRYESVYDKACQWGFPVIRGKGQALEVASFVQQAAPDLLWVTDYRYLLPEGLVALAPRGAVNLHPSLLPRFRGRASINWAILYGESQIGLTAHFVAPGVDTGNIIEQICITLTKEEDVGDALERLIPLYDVLTRKVIHRFLAGPVQGTPQNHENATEFPARKPEDGQIDWSRPAYQVRDLVRAVAAPYPGAFVDFSGIRLYIWRARTSSVPEGWQDAVPGTILASRDDGSFLVQCSDEALLVQEWTTEPSMELVLQPGIMLFDNGNTQ